MVECEMCLVFQFCVSSSDFGYDLNFVLFSFLKWGERREIKENKIKCFHKDKNGKLNLILNASTWKWLKNCYEFKFCVFKFFGGNICCSRVDALKITAFKV
jgi:hypothetical protein